MVSLESPHRRDSNEYTQNSIFNIKKKMILYYPQSASMGFFLRDSSKSSKHHGKRAVFEPLTFYLDLELAIEPLPQRGVSYTIIF